MPKRTDIKKVLVIGSGPIVIGQAAELMKAKEVQCRVTNSEELAQCFQSHTLSCFVTDNNGETTGYQNVLVTPDGLSYQFLYNDTDYPVSGQKGR